MPVAKLCAWFGVPEVPKADYLRRENDPPDRSLILLTFGWGKTVGGQARTAYRGVEPVRARFVLTMAASNLVRLPRLLAP